MGLALAPGAGALLVALGPGPAGGEKTISGGATSHVHVHATAQGSFRPGFGGHAGHYVYPNARPPQLPSWGLALPVGLAAGATYLAAGALQRRRADGERRVAMGRGVPA